MRHRCFRRIIRCALNVALCLTGVLLAGTHRLPAQQLSIHHYDVSNGLANSHVSAMYQDAKGYLWLATWEGLSRFDGYRFTNYGERDGLRDPIINAIAQDRLGRLWIGTNGGGVARLVDNPQMISADASTTREKFFSFPVGNSGASNRVNALVFDAEDNLWCGTDGGLYKAAVQRDAQPKFEAVISDETEIDVAFADSRGRLWFGMQKSLIEIDQGQITRYGSDDEVGRYEIKHVIEDRQGGLLVANGREVLKFVPPSKGKERGQWQPVPLSLRPKLGIETILSDHDGTLWIGTWDGLIKYQDGKQTFYSSAQGLSDNDISSLTEDRDDNLWIGTRGGGVCKLSSELIVSFTKTEGLPNQSVVKVVQDQSGNIYASVRNGGLVRIVEGKAVPIPGSQSSPFSDVNERLLQDQHGDWWIGTGAGLFRFAGPDLQLDHGRKFTAADGLPGEDIQGSLYKDPQGRIWANPFGHGLYYSDPTHSGQLVFKPGLAGENSSIPNVLRMVSDRSGDLWLGGNALLAKFVNGHVVVLQPSGGLPETNPRAFFVDSRGWLWIGLRYKGVSVTKDPGAKSPVFSNYSTGNGMASDAVWAIAEDDSGHMYFGTGKGLDQLDIASGRIRHFNTDDGLAGDVVNACFKDRDGDIWVGTTLGLSRFNPRAERDENQPAPIYLSHIAIAGEDVSLPETGTQLAPQLELSASRNNLTIEYVALNFEGEDKLRYQYKLEGVDKDWSAPTEVRSIKYARLAPGSYRFTVRAINQEGIISPDAAMFQFRILPPVWLRWWFLSVVVLLISLIVYYVHRQRVARSVELERVRTRIATDLHDDIGANLSLIAMLSEVARGQMQIDDHRLKEWFSTIAATSRDTVDSMSDIVWAVNPKRDHLRDLTQRMRRFADDILGARNIALRFREPDSDLDLRLGADLRREVFLIFKETINNLVRHSQCTEAEVDLQITRGRFVLRVSDNGRGLNSATADEGTGLTSMRGRATRFGGTLETSSPTETGTIITLDIPLDHRLRP
jgi:ligand-binding sensor domain-containing protein/signal transduction histidine kinase